jgi:hypothetical protein
MTDYQIEDDIPVPEIGRGRKRRYPFRDMAVSQSFVVADASRSAINAAARRVTRELGWQFTVHKTRQGFRVWRVA